MRRKRRALNPLATNPQLPTTAAVPSNGIQAADFLYAGVMKVSRYLSRISKSLSFTNCTVDVGEGATIRVLRLLPKSNSDRYYVYSAMTLIVVEIVKTLRDSPSVTISDLSISLQPHSVVGSFRNNTALADTTDTAPLDVVVFLSTGNVSNISSGLQCVRCAVRVAEGASITREDSPNAQEHTGADWLAFPTDRSMICLMCFVVPFLWDNEHRRCTLWRSSLLCVRRAHCGRTRCAVALHGSERPRQHLEENHLQGCFD